MSKILEFVETWTSKAREFAEDHNPQQHINALRRFDTCVAKHVWIVVCPPHWGDFVRTRADRLDADTQGRTRKRAHQGLVRCRKALWEDHNIAVIFPSLENPVMSGVHLAPISRMGYGTQITTAMTKMLCDYCSPRRGIFNRVEYDSLTKLDCKRLAQQAPPQ